VLDCLRPRRRVKDLSATYTVKSPTAAGAMLLVVLLVVPAQAEKGQSSYKQGRDLEARQNYEGAYEAYERAYDAAPATRAIARHSPEFASWLPRPKCTVRHYCSRRESSKRL
jgi:hypothetical protein